MTIVLILYEDGKFLFEGGGNLKNKEPSAEKKKMIVQFFAKTSLPRIIKQMEEKKEQKIS